MIPTQIDSGTLLQLKQSIESLEKEAQDFAQTVSAETEPLNSIIKSATIVGFISGTESNWVKAEKIRAQIEILEKHRKSDFLDIEDEIESFKQRLKKLEDENS
jgi:hypothetical protein